MGTENLTVKVKNNDPSPKSGLSAERLAMAERLKAHRKGSGFTVVGYGQLGNVTKQTQLAYENGSTAPHADYLRAIHGAMGVDISYLVTGRELGAMKGVSAREIEMLARYRDLPTLIRKTVDDVLLLAWLSSQARKAA